MTDFCVGAPMLQRVLLQADLMNHMMECVGVAPARASRLDKGMAFYEARSRCIACAHDRLCRRWIEAQHGATASEPPGYCANREFLRRARQPASTQRTEDYNGSLARSMGAALAPRADQQADADGG
jgi:hypothetical protein